MPRTEAQKGIPEEVQSVYDRLTDYDNRFREIMDAIADKRFIPPAEKHRLQQLFKSLKEDLARDCKEEAHRRNQITSAERYYFYPAVVATKANINVAWNSHPINSDWLFALAYAREAITRRVFEIKEKYYG